MEGFQGGVVGHIVSEIGQHVGGGFTQAIEQQISKRIPTTLPSHAEIFKAWKMGLLTDREYADLSAMHGVSVITDAKPSNIFIQDSPEPHTTAWAAVLQTAYTTPSDGEILNLINRGLITQAEADNYLRMHGWFDKYTRELFKALRFEIPTPADLIRFGVKHVFEPDLIDHFKLNEEFPPAHDYWFAKLGLTYDARTPQEKEDGRKEFTWAQAHWWSHWVQVSPTQGYTMYQRLRPTGGKNGGPRDPSGEVMTEEDLLQLMRQNDYPPFWRKKLIAIAYHPIGVRRIEQLYQNGVVDKREVEELWKDQGFNERNAHLQTELIVEREARRQRKEAIKGVLPRLIRSYEAGIIDREDLGVELYRLNITNAILLQKFDEMKRPEQEDYARADDEVQAKIAEIDADIHIRRVKEQVTAVKRRYIRGLIDVNTAAEQLHNIGIKQEAIVDYTETWGMEITPQHKELQTAKILSLLQKGIIGVPQAVTRLRNLGLRDDDIAPLLLELQYNERLRLAKLLEKLAKDRAAKDKARASQLKALERERQATLKRMTKKSTDAQVMRWFVMGIIKEDELVTILRARNWRGEELRNLIEESKLKRDEYEKKHHKAESAPT